jgi:hypothetical protein
MTLCTAFARKESFLLIFSGLAEILFGLPAVVFRRLCLPGNSILNQTGYITFNRAAGFGSPTEFYPRGQFERFEIEGPK